MSINQSTNSDAVWAVVKCLRSFRCEAMKEEGDRGICSLWKGDEWLLLSWQIVRKAIEDVTTVIKEQLIDLWEVLQWIYHTHTHTQCESEQEEHHPGSICKDVYKNKHYPLPLRTYIFFAILTSCMCQPTREGKYFRFRDEEMGQEREEGQIRRRQMRKGCRDGEEAARDPIMSSQKQRIRRHTSQHN